MKQDQLIYMYSKIDVFGRIIPYTEHKYICRSVPCGCAAQAHSACHSSRISTPNWEPLDPSLLCFPNTCEMKWTQSTLPPYNMDTPYRVTSIMDRVKQKLKNPDYLTRKQIHRKIKSTASSLTTLFPYHHQPVQENSRIPRHPSHKLFRNYRTGHSYQDHTSSPVITKFLVTNALPTYNEQSYGALIKRIKEHEAQSRL